MMSRAGTVLFVGAFLTMFAAPSGCRSTGDTSLTEELEEEMKPTGATYTLETKKSVEEAGRDLEAACKRHAFGVLGTYDLQEKMREKGVDFDRECRIVEICNPHKAKQVLEWEMKISTALPCRVSIYRVGDTTYLSTIPPMRLIEIFGTKGLEPVAMEVQETIYAIMEEAAAPGD